MDSLGFLLALGHIVTRQITSRMLTLILAHLSPTSTLAPPRAIKLFTTQGYGIVLFLGVSIILVW